MLALKKLYDLHEWRKFIVFADIHFYFEQFHCVAFILRLSIRSNKQKLWHELKTIKHHDFEDKWMTLRMHHKLLIVGYSK
jgi:hypothetical protein